MDNVKIEKLENGIVVVTLNRPNVHNSFNTELLNEFNAKLEVLKIDKSARLIILLGNPATFAT